MQQGVATKKRRERNHNSYIYRFLQYKTCPGNKYFLLPLRILHIE